MASGSITHAPTWMSATANTWIIEKLIFLISLCFWHFNKPPTVSMFFHLCLTLSCHYDSHIKKRKLARAWLFLPHIFHLHTWSQTLASHYPSWYPMSITVAGNLVVLFAQSTSMRFLSWYVRKSSQPRSGTQNSLAIPLPPCWFKIWVFHVCLIFQHCSESLSSTKFMLNECTIKLLRSFKEVIVL